MYPYKSFYLERRTSSKVWKLEKQKVKRKSNLEAGGGDKTKSYFLSGFCDRIHETFWIHCKSKTAVKEF